MTTQRKTFNVNDFRLSINAKLLLKTISEEQKSILCSVLEGVLMDSNNYRGFGWVEADGTALAYEAARDIEEGDYGYFQRRYY